MSLRSGSGKSSDTNGFEGLKAGQIVKGKVTRVKDFARSRCSFPGLKEIGSVHFESCIQALHIPSTAFRYSKSLKVYTGSFGNGSR